MANGRTEPVPDRLTGVWRRTLLRTAAMEDSTSIVYWLQTPRWHADIRIPGSRPAIHAARGWSDLDRDQCVALAAQQGFAGITTLDGDVCRWHSIVDYQPPTPFGDVGRLEFDGPDRLLEHGVEQDYFEIWERVPGSGGRSLAIGTTAGSGPEVKLLRSGDFAMRVRARTFDLPPAVSLAALCEALARDELVRTLDFEISLAHRAAPDDWRILHSTLPWLEQTRMPESAILDTGEGSRAGEPPNGWRGL